VERFKNLELIKKLQSI